MAQEITASNFDEALHTATRLGSPARRFWAFVDLAHAVLFTLPATRENDRRQNALDGAISREGMDREDIRARARNRNFGVGEYPPYIVQEIEVLVDGLDDPKTRWFIADFLLHRWYLHELRVPVDIHERIVSLLGVPLEAEHFAIYRKAKEALKAARSPGPSGVFPRVSLAEHPILQPQRLYVCRDYLFEDAEWAQAYADFMEAEDRRHE